ncbi:MAG: tRNA (adenosine(37)-N6)-dimethylallyltransferase MiaA [Gemmatimonadota bacterium]|nr:tRNA (adenosine(37)-N6)-dimethylallyltransferase MiaA [Gemmatimonadota bacterium]
MSSSGGSGGADAPPLRIICGPTAAGKSALAMALAERHGLVIVSADSRQVYRGFDIGTAKPTTAERRRVRHLGIDVAEPQHRWSAARWAEDATGWMAEAGTRNAVVVGGTGLYLKALTAPFFDEPPLEPGRRAALAAELGEWPTDRLRQWATRLDPERAHLGRAQLLRAVEVALLAGVPLSRLHTDARRDPPWRARWLVVDPGDALHGWIDARITAMLDAGWVDEARALAGSVPEDAPAWQACGYRAVRDAARGVADLAAVRTDILVQTRQYAKRQRTWFRHQLAGADVTRIDPRDPRAAAAVEAWWSAEDGS